MEGEKPFRFLDLPAELRINIYEPVFANKTEFVDRKRHIQITAPKLLLASKQIYKEATKIFYGATAFYLKNIDSLPSFGRIPAEHQKAITCVRVSSDDCMWENFDRDLQDIIEKPGLKLRPGVVYSAKDNDRGGLSWINQFGQEGGDRSFP